MIKNLIQQPRFTLMEAFVFNGEKYRKLEYVADFSYLVVGEKFFIIEDSKGFKTEVYKIKKKLLLSKMKDNKKFNFIES